MYVRIFIFESMEMLLKIITILWGGVLICVIIFVILRRKNKKYICKNIEFPFFDLSKYLSMKKVEQVREPYNPPQWELFEFQVGLSVLADFSVEEIEDFEIGPDLTPREDIRYDIL